MIDSIQFDATQDIEFCVDGDSRPGDRLPLPIYQSEVAHHVVVAAAGRAEERGPRPDFHTRLRRLREERHLSKSDLAERAGVTYRTIHNLEKASHPRAQQKTLMVVAEALGVPYDELMVEPEPEATASNPRSPSRRLGLVVPLAALLLVGIGAAIVDYARSHATIEVDGHRIVARDAILGLELWSVANGVTRMHPVVHSPPASPGLVLLGVRHADASRPPLQARERGTGRIVWESGPDLDQLVRVLGEEMVLGATMRVYRIDSIDADGDGEDEFVALLKSDRYHPTALCLFDRGGTLLRQYSNKGHLNAMQVFDVDGDGREELMATGVNNAPAYGGPTAIRLDYEFWSGGSVDSLCNPWSTAPDSSYARLVLTTLPVAYQQFLSRSRYDGRELRLLSPPQNGAAVAIATGTNLQAGESMQIRTDAELQPLEVDIADTFLDLLRYDGPDSLLGMGPASPEWRARWIAEASRFGAGVR